MLRLAADENFNNDIVRGIIRRNPQIDVVRFRMPDLLARMIRPSWRGQPKPSVCS